MKEKVRELIIPLLEFDIYVSLAEVMTGEKKLPVKTIVKKSAV
jgi:hypothetical protein